MSTCDVFLSHASADKPAVEVLACKLCDEERLRVFLDPWALAPGTRWQEALEEGLAASRTCVLFLKPQRLGRRLTAEMPPAPPTAR